jgi:peptidoglycan/xylan/chitin deacetylase (PgdA/CDA1 family)
VVGADALDGMAGRPLLRESARLGHELGNHSFGHPYELSRLTEIEHELLACEQILDELRVGAKGPCGFRAPGYELSPQLLAVLSRLGFRYDSSVFPCPPYYLAKLLVLAKLRLSGQRSGSIIGSPWQQLGPSQPYRPALLRPVVAALHRLWSCRWRSLRGCACRRLGPFCCSRRRCAGCCCMA